MIKYDLAHTVWPRSNSSLFYRLQFCDVPLQILRNMHHLRDNVLQFLFERRRHFLHNIAVKFITISVKFTSNFYQDLAKFLHHISIYIKYNFVYLEMSHLESVLFNLFFMKSIYKTKNYRPETNLAEKSEISKCNQSSNEPLGGVCC